ncbi:protein mono-ADP-ribosyltransferase PARP10 isoform 1-T1 [Trichechus inunguis]
MAEASAAVELRGLPPDVPDELLTLYFENRRRSGGGPVLRWQRLGCGGVLTFQESADAARVLAHGEHVLHQARLSLRPAPPRAPGRLLLQGLPPGAAAPRLEQHVQALLRAAGLPQQSCLVLASTWPDCALVQLSAPLSEAEVGVLEEQARLLGLDGAAVTLARMPHTRAVRVWGDTRHPDPLLLELYLENEPRSGGGPLEDLRSLPGALGTVVSFRQWQVAERVLQRDHWLQDSMLHLIPHYDVLEPQELAEDARKGDCLTWLSPEAFEHTLLEAGGPARALESRGTVTKTDSVEAPGRSEATLRLGPVELLGQEGPVSQGPVELLGQEGPVSQGPVELLGQDWPVSQGPMGSPSQEGPMSQGPVGSPGQEGPVSQGPVGSPGQEGPVSQGPVGSPGQEGPVSQGPVGSPGQEGPVSQGPVGSPGQEGPVSQGPVGSPGQEGPVSQESVGSPEQEGSVSQGPVGSPGKEGPVSQGPVGSPGQEGPVSLGPVGSLGQGRPVGSLGQGGPVESLGQGGPVESLGQGGAVEMVLSMEPGALRFLQLHHEDLLASLGDVALFPLEGMDVTGFRLCGAPALCQAAEELLRSLLGSISCHMLSLRHPGSASFLLGPEGQCLLQGLEAQFQCVFGTERLARATLDTGTEEVDPMEALQAHTLLPQDSAGSDQGNVSLEEVRELLATLEGLDGEEWLPLELEEQQPEEEPPREEEEAASSGCLVEEPAPRAGEEPVAPNTRAPGRLEEEAALQLALHRSLELQGVGAEQEEAAALQHALALSLLEQPLLEAEEPPGSGAGGPAQLLVHLAFEQDVEELDRALEAALEAHLREETVDARGRVLPAEVHVQLEKCHGVSIGLHGDCAVLRGFGTQPARAARHFAALLACPGDQSEAFLPAAPSPCTPQPRLQGLSSSGLECLAESSEEFQKVVRAFYDTLDAAHSRICIVRVERVSHPLLQRQYELHRERLEQRCERRPAEQVLYHGTSASAVPDICAHGFNRSFCGRNGPLLAAQRPWPQVGVRGAGADRRLRAGPRWTAGAPSEGLWPPLPALRQRRGQPPPAQHLRHLSRHPGAAHPPHHLQAHAPGCPRELLGALGLFPTLLTQEAPRPPSAQPLASCLPSSPLRVALLPLRR